MKDFYVLALILLTINVNAQDRSWGIKVSNNITGKPITTYHQLFYSNFHPGIEGEVNIPINHNLKHQLYISGNLGVYYHRFMHTGLKLYPEFNYEIQFAEKWRFITGLGGGYIHSFENVATLRLTDNGTYEQVSAWKGRPQFMAAFNFGARYLPVKWKGASLQLSFGTFLQGPFVSGYVPLLPYNTFDLGVQVPLKKKADE